MTENTEKNCFVMMPIGSRKDGSYLRWKNVYENILKPAIEDAVTGIKCLRADDDATSSEITPDIINHIISDFLCVADVTDKNENVYYELGIRDSLENRTIIVTQDFDHLAFDKNHHRAFQYSENDIAINNEFRNKMKLAIRDIIENPEKVRSPVLKLLKDDGHKTAKFISKMNFKIKLPKAIMQKHIDNLISVMDISDEFDIDIPDYFKGYVKREGREDYTLYLFLKVYHVKENQQSYLSEMAVNLAKFLNANFTGGVFKSVMTGRKSDDFFPLPKIGDVNKLIFILPISGDLSSKEGWFEAVKFHFNKKRNRLLENPPIFFGHEIKSLSFESGNVSIEIWDFEHIRKLEESHGLIVSKANQKAG